MRNNMKNELNELEGLLQQYLAAFYSGTNQPLLPGDEPAIGAAGDGAAVGLRRVGYASTPSHRVRPASRRCRALVPGATLTFGCQWSSMTGRKT
jgi:hypothetical protein